MSRSGAIYTTPRDAEYSPLDFGGHCDGTTDDTAAIQAAINAAGAGGKVTLSPAGRGGSWLWASAQPLTLLSAQHLAGVSEQYGTGSGASPGELYMPNIPSGQGGIVAGAGGTSRLSYLRVRGSGAGTGAFGLTNGGAANSTVRAKGCHFYQWGSGTKLSASYYSVFTDCEWRGNDIGANLANTCYNMVFNSCRFDGVNPYSNYGTTILADAIESLSIFGGSIEAYGGHGDTTPHAGILITNKTLRSNVNIYGTYWETATAAGTGIDIGGTTAVALNILGSEVGIPNHSEWVYALGATGAGSLFSRGVTFFSGTTSSTTAPIAYRIDNAPGITVDLAGDVWQASGLPNASYTNGLGMGAPNVWYSMPSNATGPGSATPKTMQYLGRPVAVPASAFLQTGRAATAARPTPAAAGAGGIFYDTTLSKPIFSDGATWRDATGAAV